MPMSSERSMTTVSTAADLSRRSAARWKPLIHHRSNQGAKMDQYIQVRGVFRAKLFDKDGNLIADLGEFSNRMMTAAMDYLLNGGLRAPPTLVGPYCAVHV